MPWYVASLLSNLCIVVVEYINRHAESGFMHTLPYSLAPIVLAQWCLFLAFNGAPHWLMAWVVFALGNNLMRLVAVHLFEGHGVVSWPYVLAGTTLMLCSSFLVKEGLR